MVKHAQYNYARSVSKRAKEHKQKSKYLSINWLGLSNLGRLAYPAIPWAPNDRYSYLMVEFDGPEVRLMSLSRLQTCSVSLVGKEICGLYAGELPDNAVIN